MYETHLKAAESAFWPLEESVEWSAIDLDIARGEATLHRALHDAALIEGYLPVYAAGLLRALADDVDATAMVSIELFEGLRHYTALKRYLERVGFQSGASADAGLATARTRATIPDYAAGQILEQLTHFMGSELFASYFFLRMAERTREPVLGALLRRMSADELRHAAAAGAVLEARVRGRAEARERVLAAARAFRHYGSDIVDVPVSEENDFEAIAAFHRRVRLICGVG